MHLTIITESIINLNINNSGFIQTWMDAIQWNIRLRQNNYAIIVIHLEQRTLSNLMCYTLGCLGFPCTYFSSQLWEWNKNNSIYLTYCFFFFHRTQSGKCRGFRQDTHGHIGKTQITFFSPDANLTSNTL